jgi:hypothetical protein
MWTHDVGEFKSRNEISLNLSIDIRQAEVTLAVKEGKTFVTLQALCATRAQRRLHQSWPANESKRIALKATLPACIIHENGRNEI